VIVLVYIPREELIMAEKEKEEAKASNLADPEEEVKGTWAKVVTKSNSNS